jgi:hypothetical protein
MSTQIKTPDLLAPTRTVPKRRPKAGGIGETIAIFVTGVSSATLASATFAGLAFTLLTPLITLFGLPEWLVVALLVPVAPAAIWVFVWMFLRTVRTERSLSSDASGAGLHD